MSIEDRLHFSRRVVEVAGELHLLVADLGHMGERAFKVLLEHGADGIQLQTDLLQVTRAMGGAQRSSGESNGGARGGQRFDELATFKIFHSSFRFIASTA